MNWNLRNKFLIPTLLVMALALGAVTYTSFKLADDAISEAMLNQSDQTVKGISTQMSIWVDGIQKDLTQISHHPIFQELASQRTPNPELALRATTILKDSLQIYGEYRGMGLFDTKGIAHAYVATGTNATPTISDRAYFQKAVRGDIAISDALISKTTGKPIIVVAIPYRLHGEIKGVFVGALNLTAFSTKFIDPVKLGKTGYAFMMSRAGYLCAHPDKSVIMKARATDGPDGKEMQKNKNGILRTEWQGVSQIITYQTEPKTGWTVAVAANVDDIFSEVTAIKNSNILISLVGLILVALVVFFIVRNIIMSLNQCVGFAENVANGNLEQNLAIERHDEIGNLSASLNVMLTNLKSMIAMSENKTKEAEQESTRAQVAMQDAEEARSEAENAKRDGLLQAAAQLEEIVAGVTYTTQELSQLIQEAANGSSIQRERAAESATAIEEMNATVLEVARNAGEAAEYATSAREKAEDGESIVHTVVESIGEVEAHSGKLKTSLADLGGQAKNIESVMTVITDIADQTNLLALNAAIEAARAGEAGRGFAVVADEVRKLAEKTMLATKEVDEAIRAIQLASRENIEGMDQASNAVVRSTGFAQQSGDALRSIVDIVVANSDQVSSIATASEQQSAASEQISRGSEEVNRIATETAESMALASDSVHKLSTMTSELNNVITHLKNS
ncbi:MAG: methyl-accepting chemotaxis protein [Halodesulfovibrio sp.]|uniref:methyl-accepting chemotaxis protein n=1 Tax=Halodesulfovibrio sp. TaxID=1912772 RepID=UPI00359E6F5B